ncbi:FCD domain-containing protein [Rothia sp. (in: high G+C Gram-positive bacteria)]|uniref:FadR/GntR family transcriptional regulator n=1 Tax=Rothia sp. (in: high G+C Gram-positive bacteria) TaxID=1885016 RepID=UPI0032164BAE
MPKHQKLLDWIESELISRTLHLGDQLPDDRELARVIGLSQYQIRESLKHCEEIGLLRLYVGKRKTILSELLREPAVSAGPAIGLSLASSVSPQRDLFQTCLLLESYAVSTTPAHQAAYPELERILQRMSDPATSLSDFHDLEADFHIQLGQLSGNTLISALLATMRDSMIEARFDLVSQVPLWSATATRLRMEYRAILDAVKSEDPALARTLLIANLKERFAEAQVPLDFEAPTSEGQTLSSNLVPVDIEDQDLVPEQWGGPITPGLFDALQNIQPREADRDKQQTLPEFREEKPEGFPDGQAAQEARQEPKPRADFVSEPQTTSTSSLPETLENSAPQPPTVLRAVPTGSATRRRKGTVSPVVHATIITPPVRQPLATREEGGHQDEGQAAASAPAYRVLADQQDELNRIERAQSAAKARLAAAAQKRQEARERAQAQAAEEKRLAEQEAERQTQQRAELEREALSQELEAKLRAEELRLAALSAQPQEAENQQEATQEEAESSEHHQTHESKPKNRLHPETPTPGRKHFAVREYFGFLSAGRRKPQPAKELPASEAGQADEHTVPEGYEVLEENPTSSSQHAEEMASASDTGKNTAEFELAQTANPPQGGANRHPMKKKRQKSRKR